MGDHTLVIGPRRIRGRGNAVNLLNSGRIFPYFYNDLFEAILPNSNYPSCVRTTGDFTATPKGGHHTDRSGDKLRVSIRGDSTTQFGNQGEFQSCAE
jgi:hypothetical protein